MELARGIFSVIEVLGRARRDIFLESKCIYKSTPSQALLSIYVPLVLFSNDLERDSTNIFHSISKDYKILLHLNPKEDNIKSISFKMPWPAAASIADCNGKGHVGGERV